MARRARRKIYKKQNRYYGDFREFEAVGGHCEALIEPGSSTATKNRQVAERLHNLRTEELLRIYNAHQQMVEAEAAEDHGPLEADPKSLTTLGGLLLYQLEEDASYVCPNAAG